MVCSGFKAPDTIDPKFLDPKYAFEDVDDEADISKKNISSLKKLMDQKRNRSGYDTTSASLYAECDLIEFIRSEDPYSFLSSYNRFKIDDKSLELFKTEAPPKEMDLICADIKLCGKGEMSKLLKYRFTVKKHEEAERKKVNEAKKALIKIPEKTEEDIENDIDAEIELTIKRLEKDKKRAEKKQKTKDLKSDIRKKMSVIAGMTVDGGNDEGVFSKKMLHKLQNEVDMEELGYLDSDAESDPEDWKVIKEREFRENSDESGSEEDTKLRRINRME